jgi:hypothetical protein
MMYAEKGQAGERMAQELRHGWRCAELLCPGYTASPRSPGSIRGERGGRQRIMYAERVRSSLPRDASMQQSFTRYLEKKSETEKQEKKGDHWIDRDPVLLPIHHRDIVLFYQIDVVVL